LTVGLIIRVKSFPVRLTVQPQYIRYKQTTVGRKTDRHRPCSKEPDRPLSLPLSLQLNGRPKKIINLKIIQ